MSDVFWPNGISDPRTAVVQQLMASLARAKDEILIRASGLTEDELRANPRRVSCVISPCDPAVGSGLTRGQLERWFLDGTPFVEFYPLSTTFAGGEMITNLNYKILGQPQ